MISHLREDSFQVLHRAPESCAVLEKSPLGVRAWVTLCRPGSSEAFSCSLSDCIRTGKHPAAHSLHSVQHCVALCLAVLSLDSYGSYGFIPYSWKNKQLQTKNFEDKNPSICWIIHLLAAKELLWGCSREFVYKTKGSVTCEFKFATKLKIIELIYKFTFSDQFRAMDAG